VGSDEEGRKKGSVKPYYSEDGIEIYFADCRQALPNLERVDHVITDPPYSDYVHSKSRRGGASAPKLDGSGRNVACSFAREKEFGFEALSSELREFCAREFARLSRLWVLVFSDVESCHLWRDDLVTNGLEYVRTGAWVKLGATPQFTGDRPAAGFETITIAHPKGRKQWNGGGRHAIWREAEEPDLVYEVPIVLNRSHNEPRLHTTQKPIRLMLHLIGDFTDEGETILDSFMGSGTTLDAAKRLGRKAIGIDSNEQNCETAANRIRLQARQQTIGFKATQSKLYDGFGVGNKTACEGPLP
jgi:site-specific DNA-methyltransferase (adenine-specific)